MIPPTTPSLRLRDRFSGGLKKIPTFLAFVLAPYFYFVGASAQSARFEVLGISGVGFSSSAGEYIYDGFNIFLENTLPWIAWKLPYISIAVGGLLWGSLAVAKSAEPWAVNARAKLIDWRTWWRLQFDDVGIVYAPLVAILFGLASVSIFLGWIGVMSIGQSSGRESANKHLANIRKCVSARGQLPDCTTITVINSSNVKERIAASIVFMDKDRAAILDGQAVRLIDAKQIASVTTFPKKTAVLTK